MLILDFTGSNVRISLIRVQNLSLIWKISYSWQRQLYEKFGILYNLNLFSDFGQIYHKNLKIWMSRNLELNRNFFEKIKIS